jgi:hypothetical protein
MPLTLLSPELSQAGAGRAYLEQMQCNRHGLQLPQQVHGTLLEGEGTFIKDFRTQWITLRSSATRGTQDSDNLQIRRKPQFPHLEMPRALCTCSCTTAGALTAPTLDKSEREAALQTVREGQVASQPASLEITSLTSW